MGVALALNNVFHSSFEGLTKQALLPLEKTNQ
jgi:hypothetical protein